MTSIADTCFYCGFLQPDIRVVGFDCEWKPNTDPVALIQLATLSHCVLIRILEQEHTHSAITGLVCVVCVFEEEKSIVTCSFLK